MMNVLAIALLLLGTETVTQTLHYNVQLSTY